MPGRKSRKTRKLSPDDAPVKSTNVTPEVAELTLIQEEREVQASPVLPPAKAVRPVPAPALHIADDLDGSEIRAKLEE